MIKKIISGIVKFILFAAVVAVLMVAVIFLYINISGKTLLEDYLSGLFGAHIKFKTVSLNFGSGALNLGGLAVESEIGLDREIFNARVFTLKLNKTALEKDRKLIFDQIVIDSASVSVERKADGTFGIIMPVAQHGSSMAQTGGQKSGAKGGFYSFVKTVRKISVTNSSVKFWDRAISRDALLIICKNAALQMVSDPASGLQSGYVPVEINASFDIQTGEFNRGTFEVASEIKVYEPFFEAQIGLKGRDIDIDQIKPYLDAYTPFIFSGGVFNVDSRAVISKDYIDSITTIVFDGVRVIVDPRKQDSEFLQTSVNKLVPYLTSNQGEIIFDFVISGLLARPSIGMGPKLKNAAGQAAMEEVGRVLQGMQNVQ